LSHALAFGRRPFARPGCLSEYESGIPTVDLGRAGGGAAFTIPSFAARFFPQAHPMHFSRSTL